MRCEGSLSYLVRMIHEARNGNLTMIAIVDSDGVIEIKPSEIVRKIIDDMLICSIVKESDSETNFPEKFWGLYRLPNNKELEVESRNKLGANLKVENYLYERYY